MISYLISIVFYFVLLILIKNTYVSPIKKGSWYYKESDYTEKLKLPLWLWFISIVLFLIPILNAFSLGVFLFSYVFTINIKNGVKLNLLVKFLNF